MITSSAQRWRDGRAIYRPTREPIDTSKFDVAPILDDNTAKAFVIGHHYSGSYPAARARFGLYRAGTLEGVAVFSIPCNSLALKPCPDLSTSVELGRFVLLDCVKANGETWFLARCFELLREAGFTGVVSFSDPMERTTIGGEVVFAGHIGGIYQAHNALYLGRARAENVRLLPDGKIFHKRLLAKVRGREKGWRYIVDGLVSRYGVSEPRNDLRAWIDGLLPGLTRTRKHPGNHKYVWPLRPDVRRFLKKNVKAQPYPKFSLLAEPSRAVA